MLLTARNRDPQNNFRESRARPLADSPKGARADNARTHSGATSSSGTAATRSRKSRAAPEAVSTVIRLDIVADRGRWAITHRGDVVMSALRRDEALNIAGAFASEMTATGRTVEISVRDGLETIPVL